MKIHVIRSMFFLIVFFALILAGPSCSKKPETSDSSQIPAVSKPKGEPKTNMIVILVDTMREDYLSLYDSKYQTPVMDFIASQGVTFSRAYSPSSWTVPSIASLFTGMYPEKHGLIDGIALSGQVSQQQQMPQSYVTLAEQFKNAGYTTFAVTTNSHLDKIYHYNSGFDFYKMFRFSDGDILEEQVRQWKPEFKKAADETGYFVYLHWVDPHHNYNPREPFISRIRPDYLKHVGSMLENTPEELYLKGYFKDYPDRMGVLKDLYASEICWTDESIGRVLKMLPDISNTMIVVMSDHGEAFAEHKSMLHGIDLYQETVHVPLIFKFPDNRYAGTFVNQPVSLVDVAPTLCAFAGIAPWDEYQGTDITNLMSGKTIPDRLLYSHLDKLNIFDWKAVFDKNLKLAVKFPSKMDRIQAKEKGITLEEKYFLYDLDVDPHEKTNLAESRSEDVARLYALLLKEMNTPPLASVKTVGQTISKQEIEKLKGLSYLK